MSLNIVWDNNLIDILRRNREAITDAPYGAISTADTPALGAIAIGSQIPAGRFAAWSPMTMHASRSEYRSVILPDKLGTNLIMADNTSDFSAIISDAFNAAGDFEIAGVSILSKECHSFCRGGCKDTLYPHNLINPQAAPIGYHCEDQKCNYYDLYSNVSLATDDYIFVYAEVAFKPGDEIHIRTEVLDANATHANGAPVQLLGGITNASDAGTQLYTRGRVIGGSVAGSSVLIELD